MIDSTTTAINQGESLKITGSGGVTTSLSGDTLTIAGAHKLTVQEEGSSLSTAFYIKLCRVLV